MRVARRVREWVPRWWAGEGGPTGSALNLALLPAEGAYRAIVSARNTLYAGGVARVSRVPLPVISVGNIWVGGTGKTPVAAWLVSRLAASGRHPAVVLRGYGADEVLVHRELNPGVPVLADARRVRAVREALAGGADCIVMDDGFQHRGLDRDLDIVLVSAEQWRGNRRLLPRGPLREPLASLRRADLVIVTRKTAEPGEAEAVLRELREYSPSAGGIAHLRSGGLEPLVGAGEEVPLEILDDRDVLAVTSIAEPGSFQQTLSGAGARLRSMKFPDHHEFVDADLREIERQGEGRAVVVSRKDAVKLRSRWPAGLEAWTLIQKMEMESGLEELDRALERAGVGSR